MTFWDWATAHPWLTAVDETEFRVGDMVRLPDNSVVPVLEIIPVPPKLQASAGHRQWLEYPSSESERGRRRISGCLVVKVRP